MRRRRSEEPSSFQKYAMLIFALINAASFGYCESSDLREKQFPEFNFDKLGDIVVGGNFDGFTKLIYDGQETVLQPLKTSEDQVIFHHEKDTYVQYDFANGIVHQSCDTKDMSIMAGNFTSVFNTTVNSGIAGVYFNNRTAFDITNTLNMTDSLKGVNVNAMWCNNSDVYIGGNFRLGNTWGVAVYDSGSNTWSRPDFGGFVANSSIHTIVPRGDNIIFGGKFSGLALPPKLSSLEGNSSLKNDALLKPGVQPVSFNLANVSGYNSLNGESLNASSILCPLDSQSGWQSGIDSTTGFINVTLAYLSEPTWIRLYNLADGSGTKSFRIISEPSGSFMNLTYTDETNTEKSCAAFCPLPEYNSSIRYTDFQFVNVVPTSSLQIQLLDFYGDHAGLKGIELFENGPFVFAFNAFNAPRSCSAPVLGDSFKSPETNLVGRGWSRVNDFMSTEITDKSLLTSTFAEFNPEVGLSSAKEGRYEVLMHTPGCEMYNTCNKRGQVNVTVYPGLGSPQTMVLYQTNEDEKYDVIYKGTLHEGAYIRVTPMAENNVPMNLVVYKLSLHYLGPTNNQDASTIFEYSPANFSSSGNFVTNTSINRFGKMLGKDASVTSLVLNGTENLLIGGSDFPHNVSDSNLISLPLTEEVKPQTIPLDSASGSVTKLVNIDGSCFVLTNERTYQLRDGNLNDTNIGPSSGAAPFTLNGTRYWAFTPSNGSQKKIPLFDADKNQWLPATSGIPGVYGRLTSIAVSNNATIYTGSVNIVEDNNLGNAITISGKSSNGALPYSLSGDASGLRKRDTGTSNYSIYGGTYIGSERLLLVGRFDAVTSRNLSAHNALQIYRGDGASNSSSIAGIEELPHDSTTIKTIELFNNTLIMGGEFSGTAASKNVQSLLVYFVSDSGVLELADNQPQQLNKNSDVIIDTLAFKPDTGSIVVGGRFSAGERVSNGTCNSLCMYDANKSSWESPAGLSLGVESEINSLVFQNTDTLVLAGDIKSGDVTGQVAVYDFRNGSLSMLPTLPGKVTQLVVLSNSTQEYAVAVNSRVLYYDGSHWQDVPQSPLNPGSSVSALSLVELQNDNSTRTESPFSADRALLVSGDLKTQQGTVSMMVFDGHQWTPLYVATDISQKRGGTTMLGTVFSERGDLKGGVTNPQASRSTGPGSSPSGSVDGPRGRRGEMPAGHVVGIACAIGVCCVLLLTFIYLVVEWFLTRGESSAYQNLAQYKPSGDLMAGTKVVR